MSEPLKLAAKWTNDCQGKKDYDARVVVISTRYWPSGGGFHILDSHGFNPSTDPRIRPHASCQLEIVHGDPEGGGDREELASFEVDGDSFDEVAVKVEEWAQERMDEVVELLRGEFNGNRKVAAGPLLRH